MWKPFLNSENLHMLRLEQNEQELTLLLTDFSCLWESEFSAKNLVDHFKNNNPLIAATDSQIKDDLFKLVNDLHKITVSIIHCNDNLLQLNLEQSCSELSQYAKSQSIFYKFSLEKKTQDEFKTKVTVSAIQTIYFLESQQKMLLNLVQKKDRELAEYRMEKGEISRGDLKTDKFEIESMKNNNDKLFLNVFTNENNREFWNKFTEENGNVQMTSLSVETEPWNAKKRKRVIYNSKSAVKKGAGVIFKN